MTARTIDVPALAAALDDSGAAANANAPDGDVQAAVLVPVLAGLDGEATLVLTRRHADMRRHAGEISFPGGRRDDGDATLIDTALREAHEEIGLSPARVEIAGALPATSTFVTRYAIQPFVGLVSGTASWTRSPLEVAEILELPLGELARSRTEIELTRRGFTFQTGAYVIADLTIWGATARIVDELLRRIAPLIDVG